MATNIKIIADGTVLKALELAFDATEFSGDHTEPGTTLVVYEHALISDVIRRSDKGGLKLLQKLLAHQASEPIEITVLSFSSPRKPSNFDYLLPPKSSLSFFRIPTSFPLPSGKRPSSTTWRELTRIASEMELEVACSSYRHGLRSVMAAARIYLGAAIVNHISSTQCEIALPEFQTLVQREDPSIKLDHQELLKQLKQHERFGNDYASYSRLQNSTVWVLDDHWTDHGWKILFDDLLPGKARGFTKWELLESQIQKGVQRPDILMVDCNLGQGGAVPTGLELLHSIRSVWQDVRIVFSTAYDDASLALTSLREGANVFFAKTLDDPADRRSRDYYLHLLDILSPRHPIEVDVSLLWKDFTEGPSAPNPLRSKNGFPAPPDTAYRMLRLGFYLLFSLIDDELWWRGKEWGATDEKHLFRAVINLVRAGFPALRESLDLMPGPIRRTLRGGPHGGEPIDFDDLKRVMSYLFNELDFTPQTPKFKPWSREWPHYWPYQSSVQLQADSTYPGLPIGEVPVSHEVADSQGAIELIRGAYCNDLCRKKHAPCISAILEGHTKNTKHLHTYGDIAFIDDRGDKTGWFDVIRAIFPGCRCFVSVESFLEDQRKTNLVILDLRLPTVHESRQALRSILNNDPSMPVLTLSAARDSLAAIRSLRDGAFEHASKTLPGHRDLAGCFQFYDEFVSKCGLLLKYGNSKCRGNWKRLSYLRKGLSWVTPNAKLDAMAKVKQCEVRYKALTKGIQHSELTIPPPVDDWNSILSDELALLLRLQQQAFWINEKETLPPNKNRLNYKRVFQIQPIDYWRWEHVLVSTKASPLVKLIATLSGVMVDRLAQWNWSLIHLEPVNPYLWGTKGTDGTRIEDEVKLVRGDVAWKYRNKAIAGATGVWKLNVAEEAIDSVLQAIHSFLSQQNAEFKK